MENLLLFFHFPIYIDTNNQVKNEVQTPFLVVQTALSQL